MDLFEARQQNKRNMAQPRTAVSLALSVMDRTLYETGVIAEALRRKRCRCHWIFISIKRDKYKLYRACHKPCRARDEVLRKLNVG
jgi:hypothetical protein